MISNYLSIALLDEVATVSALQCCLVLDRPNPQQIKLSSLGMVAIWVVFHTGQ